MALVSEAFSKKVHSDEMLRIKQYLEKVLNVSDSKDDVLTVFKALDDGAHVDIAQVTDSYV